MKENVYRSAAEKELLNILTQIAIRIAENGRLESATGNAEKKCTEILQKTSVEGINVQN